MEVERCHGNAISYGTIVQTLLFRATIVVPPFDPTALDTRLIILVSSSALRWPLWGGINAILNFLEISFNDIDPVRTLTPH